MKTKYKISLAVLILFGLCVGVWLLLPEGSLKSASQLIGETGHYVKKLIEFLGYPGITILMAMESMIFPLPSELVMPFAGFLAEEGSMKLWLVILFSSLGSIIGSLISYYIGYYGGNKFVLKFGKYFLLDVTDLEKTEKWFAKKGEKTIFISRFIPVVRHLISIPGGIGKMDIKKFCIYTILGATMWNSLLAYLGFLLGKNWEQVRHYSEYFSISVAALFLVAGTYVIYRHFKNKLREKKALAQLK